MDQALMDKVVRVRRGTRNEDMLDICDVLEKMLASQTAFVRRDSPWRNPETGKFDKRAYMREYMRKRRGSKNPFEAD